MTEASKDMETAARDLQEAVKRNKFGVLHVHDLQRKLALFPGAADLKAVAEEVERETMRMVDEAK